MENTRSFLDAGNATRNLDLLRAVAVLCVLVNHLIGSTAVLHNSHHEFARRIEALGHIGVLFFFVHTALVLMRSLDRSSAANNHSLVLNFWTRRACRIYPLCWALLIAILAFKIPEWVGLPYTTWSWQVIVSNFFLIQNLTHMPDMSIPLWSLPYEAQMYLALPFIFLLLRRFPSVITVLVLWFVSMELIPYMKIFSYTPCFLGGVLAFQLARERRAARLPGFAFFAGILALMAGYVAVNWSTQMYASRNGHLFLVSGGGLSYDFDFLLCMAVGMLIPNAKDIGESFVARVSQVIAKHSYGVYLCHTPVIWLSFECLSRFSWLLQWSVCGVLLIVLPWIAFRFIEAPMVRFGQGLGIGTPRPLVIDPILVSA